MEQQLFFKYYRNFVSYRKSSFPSIPALFYTEWLRNKNLAFPSEPPLSSAAYSQQLPPQQQDCSNISFYNSNTETPTESSDSVNSTQGSCGEQKKKCESWASKIPLIWKRSNKLAHG